MNYIFFTLSPTDYQVKGDAPAENQEWDNVLAHILNGL